MKRSANRALLVLVALASCRTAPVPVRQPGDTVVYLVRHAEKVTTNPNAADPDINSLGRERAKDLSDKLASDGIKRIIVTDLRRTQQTADPLATRLGITPEVVSVSLPGHTDSVAALALSHPGESVLIVGHSLTIPLIIGALGGQEPRTICEDQYSDLFVVTIPVSGVPRVEHRHYGRADPPGRIC